MADLSLSEQAVQMLKAAMAAHVPPLSVRGLAKKAGVSHEAIAKILRNEHNLQMETFERYLAVAGGQAYLVSSRAHAGEYDESVLDPYAFAIKAANKRL